MSDTLIVYYSLEGNVDFVARAVAKECGADVYQIETVKEYAKRGLAKFLHGGRDVTFGLKPELKGNLPDLAAYSKVVLGCPVWASKPAAPMSSFLDKVDLHGKKVFVFASSAGGNAEKCIDMICNSISQKGGNVEGNASFVNPAQKPEEAVKKIKAFSEKIIRTN